jgi:hypothetical protein
MIYIACPEKYATGGTELLHQLYFKLKVFSPHVKIFYYNYSETGTPVNERFEKYNVEYVNKIIDEDKNFLIVPEVATELINQYKNINKSIWWLSVDNYFYSIGDDKNFIKKILRKMKLMYKRKLFGKKVNFEDSSILHLYQSYYAKNFLEQKNVKKLEYLSDYIGSNFLSAHPDLTDSKRQNKVLYNPKKGIEFTKKIIAFENSIEYTPLINLNQDEIIELCKTSKVYIDFGNHPGKDRFPREAAHLGCIIITGKRGSAKFFEDVKTPEQFKFDDIKGNVPKITNEIKKIFGNYNNIVKDFNDYREMIGNEENAFEDDVKKVWTKHLRHYDN